MCSGGITASIVQVIVVLYEAGTLIVILLCSVTQYLPFSVCQGYLWLI